MLSGVRPMHTLTDMACSPARPPARPPARLFACLLTSDWCAHAPLNWPCVLAFGILKGRWKILKVPSLFNTVDKITNVFPTCTLFHNRCVPSAALCLVPLHIHFALSEPPPTPSDAA